MLTLPLRRVETVGETAEALNGHELFSWKKDKEELMGPESAQPTVLQRVTLLREEIRFEHSLICTRLNAFITAQSFLFAAYAVSGIGEHQQHQAIRWFSHVIVPCIGVLFSLLLSIAFDQARRRLAKLNIRLRELLLDSDGKPVSDLAGDLCLASLGSRRLSLFYAFGIPLICGAAWLFVGVCSVFWNRMMV